MAAKHKRVGLNAPPIKVAECSELIQGRLYFIVLSKNEDSAPLQSYSDWKKSIGDVNDNSVFYVNAEDSLTYNSYFMDFGPLKLAMVYSYVTLIRAVIKEFRKVVHYTYGENQKQLSNSAFLMCAFMIMEKNWTAQQAYSVVSKQYKHYYIPFRDASGLTHTKYTITVEECVNALFKAKWYGFFDISDFDLDEYEKYEEVENGGICWIVPGTLLAFPSPYSGDGFSKSDCTPIHSPDFYYHYFKENNVQHIVRLNSSETYDAKSTFVAVANIQHTDLFFGDGTIPTNLITGHFLHLCEEYIYDFSEVKSTNKKISQPNVITTENNFNRKASMTISGGAVAVHCKAGLGRTGCLLASYIIKHWSFTAAEAIAWIRICRPGSVIGVQQKWLIDIEKYLKMDGQKWRERRNNSVDKYIRFKNGVYSIKRNISNANAYEYIAPPPESYISNDGQFFCKTSGDDHI